VHYGIVHYGTDPKDLKSIVNKFITPWRANRGSPLNAIEVRPSSRASCRTGRSERQLVCGVRSAVATLCRIG